MEKGENDMWTISEVKSKARLAFKANYWKCVLVSLIVLLIAGGTGYVSFRSSAGSDQVSQQFQSLTPEQQGAVLAIIMGFLSIGLLIGCVLKMFIRNPLELGACNFFKINQVTQNADLDILKTGFVNFGHTFLTLLLRDVYLALWTTLFFIPGFIKAYSYRMVPYILAEHPDMAANEVITCSRQMMDGHKWNAFLLDLSFIGWHVLGVLTLGLVEIFYTAPYVYSAQAELYLQLRSTVLPESGI